ncbi:MAG: LPS export ABC transporter permease LptG [Gammaproteobacteria bacterium]|nr:LPS export ABC transporter permease LptG [Gammaproteobacteria bacterium]
MAHIFGLTAVVALALMAIHAFLTFVAEMDTTGRGAYGYWELFQYVLWLSPSGLYLLLPIIAMLGTLLGLGVLAGQSELTAMRAAGVSLLRIGAATAAAGAVLGAFTLLLGDWLAPYGQQTAESLRTEARYGVEGRGVGEPIWLRDGAHVFHIKKLIAEDRIAAVEIYTLGRDLSLQAAMTVEDARYADGAWQLYGVRRTEFGIDSAKVAEHSTLRWEGSLSPAVLRLFVLEANALSIHGLAQLVAYLRGNNLDAADYELALWRKLVAPFTVVTMMLFAVPFVLTSARAAGAGQRLLVGIIVGLVFYVLNEVSANTGQLFRWTPAVSAAAPTVMFAALAVVRLARAR